MIRPTDVISPLYVEMQRTLHADPKGYGGKGKKWAETVIWLMRHFQCSSVLDYGCGRASLSAVLATRGVHCRNYDPAIPGRDEWPVFADLVVCTDVLEHVEPDRIHAVVTHLGQLARKAIFLVVALDPANKILSDGTNAHILLRPSAWWDETVRAHGLRQVDWAGLQMPLPVQYSPEKRSKRWIVVLEPPA